MNIRAILLGFMLLTLLSAGVAGAVYYMAMRDAVIAEFLDATDDAAEALQGALNRQVALGLNPVRALSTVDVLQQRLLTPTRQNIEQTNRVLDNFCEVFAASDCYLMDATGLTVASSNRAKPTSFVGKNFSFRPYFTQAMTGHPSVYAALGVLTKKRGIYLGAPIPSPAGGHPAGVVVTKYLVDELEEKLVRSGVTSAVVDPNGMVFIASDPDWLNRPIRALALEDAQQDPRQFGDSSGEEIDLRLHPDGTATGGQGRRYVVAIRHIDKLPGWRLLMAHDTAQVNQMLLGRISVPALLTFAALVVLVTLGAFALYRSGTRDLARRRLAEQALNDSEERLRRWNQQLAQLAKQDAIAQGQLDIALPMLTEIVAEQLAVARASIWWLDERIEHLTLADLYEQASNRHSDGMMLTAKDYPAYFLALQDKRVINADQAASHPDTREFADHYLAPLGVSSMLDALAVVEGQPVAVLCCEHVGEPRHWGADEQNMARTIADFIGIALQAHRRNQQERQLSKLSRALQQTADSIIITNPDGVIEYVNAAFENITGFSAVEAIGQTPRILKSGKHEPGLYETLWSSITRGEVYREVIINKRRDGSLYHEEITITPVTDAAGTVMGFVCSGKDISERMEDQQRLSYLAHHCVVTGLPNRFLFRERLDHALAVAHRDGTEPALLFLDLDHFKNINDTLGHDVGDEVLRAIADRLVRSVRDVDTAARLGGDEFTILLEHSNEQDAARTAERIIAAIKRPIQVGPHELFVSASIGISLYPRDGSDSETLTKHADTAMYRAKQTGRSCYQLYTAALSEPIAARLAMENELRRVLDRNELFLEYQPLIDFENARPLGFEALLRWSHPERGRISPAEFIPVLEESGMIVPVGDWILQQACQQARAWQTDQASPIKVSVNISVQQFKEATFAERVFHTLDSAGLPSAALQLEITESIVMDDDLAITRNIERLHEGGVALAIDDFGTGFSSLSYLKYLPIRVIKLDRCFIEDVHQDAGDAAIVSSVVSLAEGLGMQTIAEGVENHTQWETLLALGCDAMQGYLVSRPLPAEEATAFLQRHRAGFQSGSAAEQGAAS